MGESFAIARRNVALIPFGIILARMEQHEKRWLNQEQREGDASGRFAEKIYPHLNALRRQRTVDSTRARRVRILAC
jgi:hypothetical protein